MYRKVVEGVTQHRALNEEKRQIQLIGRVIDGTGPLLNISRGGQQGGETCKPVVQYSTDGKILATYPSVKAASESVKGANRSYITQCCKGRRVSAGGFLWAYEGNPPPKYVKKYYKQVHQMSLLGELIATYTSLTQAQQTTGIELHNISECCRGKSKTAGGYVWKYAPV